MAPEQIGNTNMWRLFEEEEVVGNGGVINGPTIVRVFDFPGQDTLLVQAGSRKIEVEGTDFAASVRRKSPKEF